MHFLNKVAVVSTSADEKVFTRILVARPDAIFPKPFDFEDFVQCLCETFPGSAAGQLAA